MIIRRAFRCDHVDDAGHRLSVLSIECSAYYFKLADAGVFDLHAQLAVEWIGDRDAIDQICNFIRAAAAEMPANDARLDIDNLRKIFRRDAL